MMKLFLKLLFYLFFFPSVWAQGGLKFISNNHNKDERTSYRVFKDAKEFKRSVTVNFDLSFYSNLYIGEILTISGFNDDKAYSLYYKYTYEKENISYLQINRRGEKKMYEIQIPSEFIDAEKWMPIEFTFDFEHNQIRFNFNEQGAVTILENFEFDSHLIDLVFGKQKNYFEVPSFRIKNLSLSDYKTDYYFPLNQKEGEEVFDKTFEEVGVVENPYWLINDFYNWKFLKSFQLSSNHNVVYDSINNRILLVGENNMIEFDLISGTTIPHQYKEGSRPVPSSTGKGFINPQNNRLLTYQIQRNEVISNSLLKQKLGIVLHKKNPPVEEKNPSKNTFTVGELDFETLQWTSINKNDIFDFQIFHHNTFYESELGSLILFGGYGDFSYFNSFTSIKLSDKTISKLDFKGDRITPRFLSGLGRLDEDSFLLYGGVGNYTGEEHIGKKYFTDLYLVNLKEMLISKKWSKEENLLKSASSENLIISDDKKSFYHLGYSENFDQDHLQLYKTSIVDGASIKLGDSILMNTDKTPNKADIFSSRVNNKIILYTKEFNDNFFDSNTISLYSVEMEPISINELNSGENTSFDYTWTIFFVFLTLLLLIVIVVIRSYLKSGANQSKTSEVNYIFVRSNRMNIRLLVEDIIAVEAVKDYIKIVLDEKNYLVHSSLSKFADQLPVKKFLRVHRSFIVNINQITSIDSDVIYLGKRYYKIGGKYLEIVKKQLLNK